MLCGHSPWQAGCGGHPWALGRLRPIERIGGDVSVGRALWQRRVDTAYGPAVFDAQPARDTLAEAEAALRAGDASRAEATYLRTLGKLGPFSDPAWQSDLATDQRTRSQCHARLAALAFDHRDYERSLRQTAAATAARREAIATDQCTDDDVRFMITALVHAATVHERVGAHDEAVRSCEVALEFADYAKTHDSDERTRRSVESARRAANRIIDELRHRPAPGNEPDETDVDIAGATLELRNIDLSSLYEPPPVEISGIDLAELGGDPAAPHLDVTAIDLREIEIDPAPTISAVDLRDIEPALDPLEFARDEVVIDLTEPEAVIDLTDPLDLGRSEELDDDTAPVDPRFERRPDHHRSRQLARRTERDTAEAQPEPVVADDHRTNRRQSGQQVEPAATLLAQARTHALMARFLAAQGDSSASIHAHRAVRTATRARPWAKHDEQITVEVAVTLVDALVTRSDVLALAGNDEMTQTDLRRARTVAEHLWRACPSAASAAAGVLVATRSAAREWDSEDESAIAAHLDLATMIIGDADALGVELPDALVTFEPPADATSERDALMALGDQLFEVLEAEQLDPALVD